MQHSNLRFLWPRTSSRVYQEVKNLASHRLVTATPDQRNGRRRTVYTITDEGHTSLVNWLGESGSGLALQHETLLKLIYTNLTSADRLRSLITAASEDVKAQAQSVTQAYYQREESGPQFPERVHLNAIVYEWITRTLEATAAWAAWASEVVDEWPDGTDSDQQTLRVWARSTYDDATTRLDRLADTDHETR
jgi:DNA-binding PadR family transcriptional regulator